MNRNRKAKKAGQKSDSPDFVHPPPGQTSPEFPSRAITLLTDFGLVVSAREGGVLYARGTDPSPYAHVTEPGDTAFRGVAFEAASAEDLKAAAQHLVYRVTPGEQRSGHYDGYERYGNVPGDYFSIENIIQESKPDFISVSDY